MANDVMVGTAASAEPVIEWLAALDVAAASHQLQTAELLATWPITEFDTTRTECYRRGDDIWIWQPDVGAIRCTLAEPHIDAWTWPGCDAAWFRQVVERSWLPAIYPLWGRQVLHASAIFCPSTGAVVSFTGPRQAGKSTTAYGISRRSDWRALADDTLAFTIDASDRSARSSDVIVHPLPSIGDVRLQLRAIYVLDPDERLRKTAHFARLGAAEAFPLLLRQAFGLSIEIPKYNQQLLTDYRALAVRVPVFRLTYRRGFSVAEELFEALELHLTTEVGISCAS
jgi:hypothetical protein